MKIDTNDLRKHYQSLSDDALLEIDPVDLNPQAQKCLEEEIHVRGLVDDEPIAVDPDGPEPEWLPDAASICTFEAYPGGEAAQQAMEAFNALNDDGIPCFIVPYGITDPDSSRPRREFRIMVPGARSLEATSVLDQRIFNPQIAEEWASHLQELSDEDLRSINPEIICAGFLDRARRLKQAYEEELSHRVPPDDDE